MWLKTEKKLNEIIPDFEQFKNFVFKFKEIVDTGKLAEFYCEKLFDLDKISPRNSGPDLETKNKKFVFEVKYRKMVFLKNEDIMSKTPPGMKIDLKKIYSVLYVYLDGNLLPNHIFQIKSEDIKYTTDTRVSFKNAFKKNKAKTIFLI